MRTEAEREAAATGMSVRKNRDSVRAAQGRIIAREMQGKGWSQSDLARASNLPRHTISRAVRGQNVLSKPILEKIAKALRLDPNTIVRDAERSSLDDMPTGVQSTPLVTGDVWLRVNAEVKQGVHLAVEALVHHDEPLTNPQLARILAVLGDHVQPA